jgi:hypothetical protein
MVDLLQSLANQRVSTDGLDDANGVREYRNFLVRDEFREPPPDMRIFTVEEANRHLCYFFGRLLCKDQDGRGR